MSFIGQECIRLGTGFFHTKSSLSNWVRAAKKGQLAEVGQGQRVPNEQELELARLRKDLAEVKQERDLLKKFAAYFAKESR